MSSARNRGQSQFGPQIPPRALLRDLLDAQDAHLLFEGYESPRPEINDIVLQRPLQEGHQGLLKTLMEQGRRLLAAIRLRLKR